MIHECQCKFCKPYRALAAEPLLGLLPLVVNGAGGQRRDDGDGDGGGGHGRAFSTAYPQCGQRYCLLNLRQRLPQLSHL